MVRDREVTENRAWGVVLADLMRGLLTKGFLTGVAMLTMGAFGGSRFLNGDTAKMVHSMELIRQDLALVRVNQEAMMDAMPFQQAEKAKKLAEDRMKAIHLAESTGR